MSVKEKPLLRAVDRLGPLPGFLFANPFFAGFFAAFMCAVFGGVFTFFWGFGFAAVDPLELFWVIVTGAAGALLFALVLFLAMAIVAPRDKEERAVRMKFVLGGLAGIVFTFALIAIGAVTLTGWLETLGPVI